jgi:hypothetical protein
VKRASLVLLCCALVQTMAPDRADAWWETIERLSGPGRFYGWSLEARLVCLVDPSGDGKTVTARLPTPLESVTASCKLKDPEVRRGSIDLNMRVVWTDNDPRFANGQRINLTTLAPSMSWSVIPSKDWDIVDFGVAAGVFWFSSTEFPSFNGGFIEPVRLDFHAPSSLKESTAWAAVIPRVRVGWIGFPGGFEPNAFAPAVPQRISRDWAMNIAVFADLEPLLRRLR